MLARNCNSFVRGLTTGVHNPVNSLLIHDQNYALWKLKQNSIRGFQLTSKYFGEPTDDPCKVKDVYKISPLCPPRGYEYKKKEVSLKCPAKIPCPAVVRKSEPPKQELKDCEKKEAKTKPKDSLTKEEKQCAKKDLKACDEPGKPPTCGKPEDCPKEAKKSVKPEVIPKKAKTRPKTKQDCTPKGQVKKKSCKKKEVCVKHPEEETCCSPFPWPFNLLDKRCNKKPREKPCKDTKSKKKMVAPSINLMAAPVHQESTENAVNKLSYQDDDSCEHGSCCSPYPWPFNFMDKNYNKPSPKKQLCCEKQSVNETVLSGSNLLSSSTSSVKYSTMLLKNTKHFHSSSELQAQPICPPIKCPGCIDDCKVSKETQKLMAKIRAVARANRKRIPVSCLSELGPAHCLQPKKGWTQAQNFILMRDEAVISKLPKKKIESPRLVTRKLRKKQ